MTREALADRVINYSDALAAFSLVNALAFVVTLGEPDIRCSIARIAGFAIGANLVVPGLSTAALVALRRFERSLRAAADDPKIERFWRWVQILRIGVVWIVAVMVSVGIWAATRDPACEAVLVS